MNYDDANKALDELDSILAELSRLTQELERDSRELLPREPQTRTPWNRETKESKMSAMAKGLQTQRLECRSGSSNKFWEITSDDRSKKYKITWGRIGTRGTTREYGPFTNARSLNSEVLRKVRAKVQKGYVPVSGSKITTLKDPDEIPDEDLMYELDFS